MSLEYVRRWYSRIPELEKDLPVLLYNGKVYTPREIYNEVVRGTALGRKLQEKLEELGSAYSFSYEDLRGLDYVAKIRAEQVIKNLPKGFKMVSIVNGQRITWTPEELKNSELFKKAVEYEKKKVIETLRG